MYHNNFNDSNLMEKFLNLKPITFKYISKNNTNNSINHLGFIAQEVEKIFPNAISYGKDFIPNINKNASFFKGGERKLVLSALVLGRETSVLSYFFVIDIAIIAFFL